MHTPDSVTGPRGISRRTLAVGAAWAVPALAVAVTGGPAAAAAESDSQFARLVQVCKFSGGSCKGRGKGYRLLVEVCNRSSEPIYVYSAALTLSGTKLSFAVTAPPLPTQLPAGSCLIVEFAAEATNSGNQSFSGEAVFDWGHTEVPGEDSIAHPPIVAPIVVRGTSPECVCPA